MTSFLNYRTTRDCSILLQLPAVLQGLSRLASHPPAARGHVHTRHLWASCPLSVRCKANVHGDCSSVKNPIFGCIFSLGLPGENPTVVPTRVAGFVCRKPYHLELLAVSWKTRCWVTGQSPLRRQLIESAWAPRGLPTSGRSCSACFAGGSIWRRWGFGSNSTTCLSLSLLPEGCMAVPKLLGCTAPCRGPKCCVFWAEMHFYCMLLMQQIVAHNES